MVSMISQRVKFTIVLVNYCTAVEVISQLILAQLYLMNPVFWEKFGINKITHHNRSLYAIGFPHRENFLAKDER